MEALTIRGLLLGLLSRPLILETPMQRATVKILNIRVHKGKTQEHRGLFDEPCQSPCVGFMPFWLTRTILIVAHLGHVLIGMGASESSMADIIMEIS